ncbi:MAG: hypothetical protein P4L51_03740 [Puia sp.]|nr:hypothetical protein [Puia sp.]
MHIQDLHFSEEIIPLFDSVQNEFSRDALIGLLTGFPGSVEEVMVRQEILRNLVDNPALQAVFSYHRSEFSEVYGWLEELQSRGPGLSGLSLKMYWFFAARARKRESGRLALLVLFFYKLHRSWFSSIEEGLFPASFGLRLRNCKRFLSELDVVKYQAIAGRRGFGIGEMTGLREFLAVKIRRGELAAFWSDFFLFEAYLSISKGILRHRFVFPVFSDGGLSLSRFYHPLIKDPVKNDLLATERVNLLTGPNMSGKSTLLKALGICVVLAHLGLAVPAGRCELPFFGYISISIDLQDDLKSGYSHFMSEIKTLKSVVEAARSGKACFAVFDELFRGTNPEDALAISATAVTGLTKFLHSYFFISTHLYQLREMLPPAKESPNPASPGNVPVIAPGNEGIGTHYIDCRLEDREPEFTYVLRRGWSDLRIGQILFDREGLNELLG